MSGMTRVTLVLPVKLWEEVKHTVPKGQRSRLVSEALKTEIVHRKRRAAFERARQVGDELLAKYGEMPSCVEDIRQMREDRDGDLTGLH